MLGLTYAFSFRHGFAVPPPSRREAYGAWADKKSLLLWEKGDHEVVDEESLIN